MPRRPHPRLLVIVFAAFLLAACSDESGSGAEAEPSTDASEDVTSSPDASAGDSEQPDASEPDGTEDASPEDTGDPADTPEPDAEDPDTTDEDIADRDTVSPDIVDPDVDDPDVDDPDTEDPDTEDPDTIDRDASEDPDSIDRDAGDEPDSIEEPPNTLSILDEGVVDEIWGGATGLSAFDSDSDPPYGDCTDEVAGTETCPSIDWQVVDDPERGPVLEVTYPPTAGHAGIVVGPAPAVDVSDFEGGALAFDIRVLDAGASNLAGGMLIKVESGAENSGELAVAGIDATGEWETVQVSMATLTASGALNLSSMTVPLVFFPAFGTAGGLEYQLDDVRFVEGTDTEVPPFTDFELTAYGAGSVSDSFNPAGYGCAVDFGFWVYNAGVVDPGVSSCTPIGPPTKLAPQVVGPAAEQPLAAHRWWGSVSFLGEMPIGDPNRASYITPDPMAARISDRGARIIGIPSGIGLTGDGFIYQIPDPFAEVFDGIAVGNSAYDGMDAYLAEHSDGSVTIEWQSGGTPIMRGTFVHGSPYAYFQAFAGDLVLRTFKPDSAEKGTFEVSGSGENSALGVWTDVAGNRNNFVVVGEGNTTFTNSETSQILVQNATKEMTVALLPTTSGLPSATQISDFAMVARNVVASVDIDYSVDSSNQRVAITHTYRDASGAAQPTMVGMFPMHWKNSTEPTTPHQVRSARGTIKFSGTSSFTYELASVGVLPALPSTVGTASPETLANHVTAFVDAGPDSWNEATDTYWAGKRYSKVAEVAAIARSIGMTDEADTLIDWLSAELADWFTAATDGALDSEKYFVYDPLWSTLLGVEESFQAHQQLNDHHFHYGYFVRAAAEICRVDPSWCGSDEYGPMVELLIRDYAGGREDPLFPYLRHFDPANGFSWASGAMNFALGNNNESTSEAANAYGAMVLYGLIVGDDDLVERGTYLHASTAAAYWEYWNNLDRYEGKPAEYDNFPDGYTEITTSIIWGQGAVFSTWFSAAKAHILGIQGLPANPLMLHVGLHPEYMVDYAAVGLSESANGNPSGLPDDQWPDIWWSLLALTDADAALADYATAAATYEPEAGESRAHTYHWLHAMKGLGHIATGTGELTADYPAAMAFDNGGTRTYVVYNFGSSPQVVSFSDGEIVVAGPSSFTITSGTP